MKGIIGKFIGLR